MRIAIFIILASAATVQALGESYDCYGAPLSHADAREISEVYVGIAKDEDASSFLSVVSSGRRASEDFACSEDRKSCRIHDDGGKILILSVRKDKMVIEFVGLPKARFGNGQSSVYVDSRAKLKTPLRVTLTARAARDCTY